jgi:hypothetical protein
MTSKDHQAQAAHHARMGRLHATALEKCRSMEDGDGEEFHKAMLDEHANMANDHLECCKALAAEELHKASLMERDAIRPDGVSSVIGEAPSIRPVLRYGQREFGKTTDGITPELAKAIGISDD